VNTVAKKLVWLVGKRGALLVVAAVAAVTAGKFGFHVNVHGFFDGPG
jgi:hypothetical protein